MAGLTNDEAKSTLDARFPTTGATDFIAYSTDGSTEVTFLARTSVGATGWAAATTADPSVKANADSLTSAAATGSGGVVAYFALFSDSTGGTQRTDWTALSSSRTLAAGDTLTWAAGALQVTLT